MSPEFGVFIMMSNYFHDVATALLLGSGIAIMAVIGRFRQLPHSSPDAAEECLRVYAGGVRIAKFSLGWILLGAIPRTIYYRSFEWQNAVDHGQIPALVIKHALAFLFVASGVFVWRRASAEASGIRKTMGSAA